MSNKSAKSPKNIEQAPAQQTIMQVNASSMYQGPIPHPSIMDGYRNIDASFPERIMRDFEANSEHIRSMQAKAQQADIDRDTRGQWMAYSLSVVLMLVVMWSVYKGLYVLGGVSGAFWIVWIIKSFMINPKK